MLKFAESRRSWPSNPTRKRQSGREHAGELVAQLGGVGRLVEADRPRREHQAVVADRGREAVVPLAHRAGPDGEEAVEAGLGIQGKIRLRIGRDHLQGVVAADGVKRDLAAGEGVPGARLVIVVGGGDGGRARRQHRRQHEIDVGTPRRQRARPSAPERSFHVGGRVDQVDVGQAVQPWRVLRLQADVDDAARKSAVLDPEVAGEKIDAVDEARREHGGPAEEVVDDGDLVPLDEDPRVLGIGAADDQQPEPER